MDAVKRRLNEYLALEWGLYDEQDPPFEDWPFELVYVGKIGDTDFYSFDDHGEAHYATYSPDLVCTYPVADMSLEDLADQLRGEDWIRERDPIDLYPAARSLKGTDPSILNGRDAVEALAREAFGTGVEFRILEGLYLEKTQTYLALVQQRDADNALVVGTGLQPIPIGYRNAPSERRLALAVARSVIGR